jgi:hypothetical protein
MAAFLFVFSSAATRQALEQLPLLASSDFENGQASGWEPSDPAHWRVVRQDDSFVYELAAPGKQGSVRAPTSWSLLAGHDVTSFIFTGRLKSAADPANANPDQCVFFHSQDPAHLYYVHFSARSDELHNIIGLVNGADRVKVNSEPPGKSTFRLTDTNWHPFKVSYDSETGRIEAFLDDMERPILTAVDKTLDHGRVGVGSYDDTGCFDDLKLWGIEERGQTTSTDGRPYWPAFRIRNAGPQRLPSRRLGLSGQPGSCLAGVQPGGRDLPRLPSKEMGPAIQSGR